MARTILKDQVLPLSSYAPGTYQVGFGQGSNGPLAVPEVDPADGSPVTVCDITIERCTSIDPSIWPQADIFIEVIPECSVDGGQTWSEAGRGKAGGGIVSFKGAEVQWSPSGGSLPLGTNRLWRCTLIVTDASGQNRSVRTSVRVEVD